jgi:hypothetical protein
MAKKRKHKALNRAMRRLGVFAAGALAEFVGNFMADSVQRALDASRGDAGGGSADVEKRERKQRKRLKKQRQREERERMQQEAHRRGSESASAPGH